MNAKVLTVEQLADRFQLSPKIVYRALERRELRGSKLGNRWSIRLADAERWFDDHVPEPITRTHQVPCQAQSGRYG